MSDTRFCVLSWLTIDWGRSCGSLSIEEEAVVVYTGGVKR